MNQFFGNSESRNKFENDFISGSNFLIFGPSHAGKEFYIENFLLNNFSSEDLFIFDGTKESSSQIEPFNFSYPRFSNSKVILVKYPEFLLENVQDSLLKTLEESPSYIRYVVISSDPYLMNNTLLSRFRRKYEFRRLSVNEMAAFANSLDSPIIGSLLEASRGLPGVYKRLLSISGSSEFISFLREIISNQKISDSDLFSVPIFITSIAKDRDSIQCATECLFYLCTKIPSSPTVPFLLEFFSIMNKCIGINIQSHWVSSMIRVCHSNHTNG